MSKFIAYVTVFTLSSFMAFAGETKLGPSAYELKEGQRIVAIGDIHGDLGALKTILESQSVIDHKGNWIAGNNFLVLTGDLVDRGPESKEVMDFVIELEQRAKSSGGTVQALLGNHEFLVSMGEFKYIHENDATAFGPLGDEGELTALEEAYKGDSKYAKWYRSRNTMIKIGDTLFVHGGLDSWVFHYSIDQINKIMNDWMKFYQGVGSEPSIETQSLLEGGGPLWNRRLSVDSKHPHMPGVLNAFLRQYGVKRVVVGHTIISDLSYTLNHPFYEDKVIMIDSAISVAYSGELSALEIGHNEILHYRYDRETGHRQPIASIKNSEYKLYQNHCVQAIHRHSGLGLLDFLLGK